MRPLHALLLYWLPVLLVVCAAVEVDIVYYTFIHPQRWAGILPGQMADLAKSGLLERAHLSVVFSVDEKHKELVARVEEAVRSAVGTTYLSTLNFSHTFKNHYEYTGLKLMHDRATQHPDRHFLYFHGKGMVFHRKPNGERIPEERLLHQQVIDPWRVVLPYLQDPKGVVQKAGFTCSPEGFVWFNYFWIRGSYLAQCKPPLLSNERYLYEHFIADNCPKTAEGGCLSLVNLNTTNNASKPFYTGLEALTLMNGMISAQLGREYSGW